MALSLAGRLQYIRCKRPLPLRGKMNNTLSTTLQSVLFLSRTSVLPSFNRRVVDTCQSLVRTTCPGFRQLLGSVSVHGRTCRSRDRSGETGTTCWGGPETGHRSVQQLISSDTSQPQPRVGVLRNVGIPSTHGYLITLWPERAHG